MLLLKSLSFLLNDISSKKIFGNFRRYFICPKLQFCLIEDLKSFHQSHFIHFAQWADWKDIFFTQFLLEAKSSSFTLSRKVYFCPFPVLFTETLKYCHGYNLISGFLTKRNGDQVRWKVTYFTAKWRNQAEWYDFWRSIFCLSKPSIFTEYYIFHLKYHNISSYVIFDLSHRILPPGLDCQQNIFINAWEYSPSPQSKK